MCIMHGWPPVQIQQYKRKVFCVSKNRFSEGSINAPSAIVDKAAHTDCSMTVPTVILYSVTEPVFAHTERDTGKLLPGGNNITSLIERWDSLSSLGVNEK